MLIFRVKIESTFFRKRHAAVVVKWSKWSFGHLVKIDFGQTKNATIIIKIYFYYYSEQQTHLENENDQNDLDHFDHL